MTKTEIEWATEVWNPTTGCTKVSAGCKNCYAEKVAGRWWGDRKFTDVRTHADRLDAPLHWRKHRRVFVNSMSDLFHDDVPDSFIDDVFRTMMRAAPSTISLESHGFVQMPSKHDFLILTKRPQRMRDYILGDAHKRIGASLCWPLPCVWLGVSCEDQKTADERIPLLLQTPAAVRFLSCEPLLAAVKLTRIEPPSAHGGAFIDALNGRASYPGGVQDYPRVDWCIVGGESGPGARPCDVAWIRSLVEQCKAAGVAAFVKQLGANVRHSGCSQPGQHWPRSTGSFDVGGEFRKHLVDKKGGDMDEWPSDLRVRELPR